MSETALMELKGTNGQIYVYEDKVVIKRKGIFAFSMQGLKGDTVFFYNNLSGIEYKKPSLIANGYIRFVVAGTNTYESKTKIWGSISKAQGKEPNTVILRAYRNIPELSEQLYNFLLQKIKESQLGEKAADSSLSSADELKKYKELFDSGVINQQEFEEKKKQLLNL